MVNGQALINHPGLNPAFFRLLDNRRWAQWHNRRAPFGIGRIPVPPLPNKYIPHYGNKERAKYAARLA